MDWKGQITIPQSAQSGVTAIADGFGHYLALKSDGSVVGWGWNSFGQTNIPQSAQSGVTAIAAGYYHSLALKADGSVVGWGYNDYGQINIPESAQSGVTAIAAGTYHSLALKADGSVVGWGRQRLRPDQHSPVSAERGDGHRGWRLSLSGGDHRACGGAANDRAHSEPDLFPRRR